MTESKRILIIEDKVKIADTLKLGLSENGYLVDLAYDGKAGIKLFETHGYNLVVLDINVPGINGYQLCKIIRSNNSQVPIIMLTALSSLDHKLEGYDAGADDYVVKPFEFRELCMKIRVLLKRTLTQKFATGSILKAADLEMNLDSKEVKRGNVVINLTAKEFQLLEYLLRNKNRVVSRADIAVNVWDIDFNTNTNVIDVYINYLRNKIDKPFEHKLVQTQAGMGYILKEIS
ncbi:MAG TPA: response regulator transcription factor [Chitinophagaceae bacterium]|nr:response regulator transcription factor [Chitinophagaceae bacterium]